MAVGIRWAWNAFTRNLGAFLVPALVYAVILIVVIIAFVILSVMLSIALQRSGGTPGYATEAPAFSVGSVLISLVVALVSALWVSGILHAGTAVLAGRRPTIKEGFVGTGTTIAVAFVVALLSAVLGQLAQGVSFVFYVPAIVVSVLLYFATVEAARGAGFGEAISASVRLVTKNVGTVVVTMLLAFAICLTMIIPILAVAVIPVMQLLVLGVHQRVTGNALVEPASV
ncbi:MAG: hypothetical protein ACTMII_00885 [Brachybacterium sp.]|uniref:hypothetical protein n=1 Tax=unclassified Brachybacterium TaxID=2623841 RepID=UPI003F8F30C9